MATIKKAQIKEFVRNQLGSNQTWALKGLLKIYEFQTAEEQSIETTCVHNNVGFTGTDGEILTSFAKQLKYKGYLSPKQMALVYKKMPKYWKQIIGVSDQIKLISMVQKQTA